MPKELDCHLVQGCARSMDPTLKRELGKNTKLNLPASLCQTHEMQ